MKKLNYLLIHNTTANTEECIINATSFSFDEISNILTSTIYDFVDFANYSISYMTNIFANSYLELEYYIFSLDNLVSIIESNKKENIKTTIVF